MRSLMAVLALCAIPASALADSVELDLPGPVQRTTVAYTCSDGVNRTAEYINAGENYLAVVDIDGAPLVFAGVIAGSGARYAARNYIWWNAHDEVTLSDEMAGEGAKPVTCQQKKG